MTASLRGAVRDSQGKPVAGASIRLRGNEPMLEQTTYSDAQGNYTFIKLRAGVYALRAEMAGYNNTEIPSLFFAAERSEKRRSRSGASKKSGIPTGLVESATIF